MQGLQLGLTLQSHNTDLKKEAPRAFNLAKDYTLVVDFNYSQRMGRDMNTFSTCTTIKNSASLRPNIALLHQAYSNYNGSLSTYVSPHKFVSGNIGGGRLDLRQGSLLLMVRFNINQNGELVEEDQTNRPVGKVLTELSFTFEKDGRYFLKALCPELKVVSVNE
ncbi:hypothetical protein K1X76_06700 [bacterium]|nr:hypothetical protein [bacterium]